MVVIPAGLGAAAEFKSRTWVPALSSSQEHGRYPSRAGVQWHSLKKENQDAALEPIGYSQGSMFMIGHPLYMRAVLQRR